MSAHEWSAYEVATFGEVHEVWEHGPDFSQVRDDFRRAPAMVAELVAAGIADGDSLAAETARELDLDDGQRRFFVALLSDPARTAGGRMQVEAARTLLTLTGDQTWAEPLADVLAGSEFWGVRADAARRLTDFAPTPHLISVVAAGVRDPTKHLLRYHCASTLLRWAGRGGELPAGAPELVPLVDEDAQDEWARVATSLAEAVGGPA